MLLYPFMGFTLRIDEERPTLTFCSNNTIIDAQWIIGKSLDYPFSDI
jgi:hypothetical protein